MYEPRPWPEIKKEPVDDELKVAVRQHLTGMPSFYSRQPGTTEMAPEALEQQVDAATPLFLLRSRTPVVTVAKDVTEEEFVHAHEELGYRGQLAGPGPRATSDALVQQHGLDPFEVTTQERLAILPPFTDLFTDLWHWWWVAVVFLCRWFCIHRWPIIVWADPAEVAWLFVENVMESIVLDGPAEDFFKLRSDEPPGDRSRTGAKVHMAKYAGEAILSNVAGHWMVVLLNYHRGCIKYDPELAQDRWFLQLAADAAHQARVGAYVGFIGRFGYPGDLESVQAMHAVGESAVPTRIRTDLVVLRRKVQQRESVNLGLRKRFAAARGAAIGASSERAKEMRDEAYLSHEKARRLSAASTIRS